MPEYYKNNNLKLFKDNEIKFSEIANYQTLFGKDYYVILRPSLNYNFTIQCQKGEFLKDNSLCQKCPINYYSNETGSVSCLKCPVGSYSLEGADSCITCLDGQYYSNGTCLLCKAVLLQRKMLLLQSWILLFRRD